MKTAEDTFELGLAEAIRHEAFNRLANYIGKKLKKTPGVPQQWEFTFCDGYYPTIDSMKFNSSFDWLAPVFQKLQVEQMPTDILKAYSLANQLIIDTMKKP